MLDIYGIGIKLDYSDLPTSLKGLRLSPMLSKYLTVLENRKNDIVSISMHQLDEMSDL